MLTKTKNNLQNTLEEKYKRAILKLPSDYLIECLHSIMVDKKDSKAVQIYNDKIRRYIKPEALPFFIGQISCCAIIYSNPHRRLETQKLDSQLYEIFKYAKEFFIDKQELYFSGDNIYNAAAFFFRNADMQFPFSELPDKFARALFLFLQLANSINSFNFVQEFQNEFRVSLKNFLQSAVLICSLTRKGNFGNNFINRDNKLILPPEEDIVTTLNLLSASPKVARNLHDELSPKDSRFRNFQFNILRMYPILQPIANKKSYIAPLPNMVLSQISEIIYYKMHKVYRNKTNNKFAEWFGDLFQAYVEYLIRNHIVKNKEIIFTEKNISKYNGKKPDLLIISKDNNIAILIECKAARRYRGAIHSADEQQLFGLTSEHIETGYTQLEEFAKNIKSKKFLLNELDKVTAIYGLLITWEDLVIFNNFAVKKNKLPPFSECNFIYTMSIDQLENFAACASEQINLENLLDNLCKSNDPDTSFYRFINQKGGVKNSDFRLYEIKKFIDEFMPGKKY